MSTQLIAQKMRDVALGVRYKPYPLADLIPLLQQAADALDSVDALEQRQKALDLLCTQVLNSRVGVENELADMVAGKSPMPDKEKLRQLAQRLGDPSFRARYDDQQKVTHNALPRTDPPSESSSS